MVNNKYIITEETKPYTINSKRGSEVIFLNRIKSITDIREDVPSGTLGGWIQSEDNLSISGSCWIYDEAVCAQNALVRDSSILRNNALVFGDALIRDSASILENAQISDYARVKDQSIARGNAKIRQNAKLEYNAVVEGDAEIFEMAKIQKNGFVTGNVKVGSCSRIKSYVSITPICISGCPYETTFSDEYVSLGCVNLKFNECVDIVTKFSKQECMRFFDEYDGILPPGASARGYDLLIRSIGFLGRISQLGGRDFTAFNYKDEGYSLIIESTVPDYRDPENKLDPMDVF